MTSINHQRMIHEMNQSFITKTNTKPTQAQQNFKGLLNAELNNDNDIPVKISKHAAQRMHERNIHIQPEQWNQIYDRMQEAKSMGIKDSLVLTNNEAMVVNTDKNTVITVMNRGEANKHIFSNINGTILLDN
ncbi:hypothetical protein GCM10011391_21210 [Pullulanibacillus camelliae]|uniref:Flagellar protein n=1 Tax=Pullulanibacillus camelliae TaxID=1707096 RepID=A0A8J2W081_9BACL|nr:TIGR02530 family flagellar biosynthesis protein [Pullulanibacillus camelliae]GGE42162.1 hypothetical protein GCM10011391_21210 [Pullulanibacillus camelliae]